MWDAPDQGCRQSSTQVALGMLHASDMPQPAKKKKDCGYGECNHASMHNTIWVPQIPTSVHPKKNIFLVHFTERLKMHQQHVSSAQKCCASTPLTIVLVLLCTHSTDTMNASKCMHTASWQALHWMACDAHWASCSLPKLYSCCWGPTFETFYALVCELPRWNGKLGVCVPTYRLSQENGT